MTGGGPVKTPAADEAPRRSEVVMVRAFGSSTDRARHASSGPPPEVLIGEGIRVALTFDAEHADRAGRPDTAERTLDVLVERSIRATFFIQGRWAQANRPLARRMADDGHLIGNHSHYHARMALFTERGFATDVRAAEWAIERATGVSPRPWFRFPFGNSGNDRERLSWLRTLGYRHIGWHVTANEWRVRARPTAVAAAIVRGVRRVGDGAIVLLHTWPDPVADAVEHVAEQLTGEVRFVRVDDLPLEPGWDPVALPRPGLPLREAFKTPR
jgi:peptidoglycan/xylan/chitin deacetylase (PgdA/CDA1 family)